MNTKLYSIYDTKAQSYSNVWQAPNHVVAIRTVGKEVNRADEGNQLHTHTEDFELFQLADLDTDTGEIKPALTKIANLSELKKVN